MRIVFGLAALATVVATTASAAPTHLSDAAYLEAARCVGLASSKALAAPDAKAMQAWLRKETNSHPQFITDMGDDKLEQAKHEADHANDMTRPQLQAELSGTCAAIMG